jgi:hypothetical protein
MPKRELEPFPSADDIAARAHELFASGGRRIAMIPEYWRKAERELLDRAANRVIPRTHHRRRVGPGRQR